MVRSVGYPNDRQWHAVLRQARIETILGAAIVTIAWLYMIRGKCTRLWGCAMGLAWGSVLPSFAWMGITDVFHIRIIVRMSSGSSLVGGILVAASQVWVAWRAYRLGQDRTLTPLNS